MATKPIRHDKSFETSGSASSYTDLSGAYLDLDAGGTFAQVGGKGPGSIGLKLRTVLAGVALTVLTFTSTGAATFLENVTMSSGKTLAAQAVTCTTITGTGAVSGFTSYDASSFIRGTGDSFTFVVRNAATTGVAQIGTVKGWLGSGSNVTDLAIGANGGLINFYTNGSGTVGMSLSTGNVLTVASGLTVSAGTAAVQALTATQVRTHTGAASTTSGVAATILSLGSVVINGESWLVTVGAGTYTGGGCALVVAVGAAWTVYTLGTTGSGGVSFSMSGNNLQITQGSGVAQSFDARAVHVL